MRLISKLLCSTMLVCASVAAAAGSYSSLVIFGDSLSDNGNNALAVGQDSGQVITGNSYIPSYTYASGVYSNGPAWATEFAADLGLSLAPSVLGGTNYAFGGAQTSFYAPGLSTPSLTMQAGMYLGSTGAVADSSGLYVVAGGGNNVRATIDAVFADPAHALALIGAAAWQFALDIGNIVDSLQAAGAQHIIVWNAPDLGSTPAVASFGPQASALGTLIAQSFNDVLAGRLSSQTDVQTFDLFGLAGQAATQGFTNTTDACGAINAPASCGDLSHALFWDGIHPTAAGHSLIAQSMYVTAVPEPETFVLMALGLALVGYRARRRAAVVRAR